MNNQSSLHFGTLPVLISFLLKHGAQEVCLKSVLSPTFPLRGESARHAGVCVSACLSTLPGTPIAYATFLAATGVWGGKPAHLYYPRLADPITHQALQEALFCTLQTVLEKTASLSVVLDAQWDVSDPWLGIAKGFVWREGDWQQEPVSPASLFSIS